MSRVKGFIITAGFLGLVAYEEGVDSALKEIDLGLLTILWAVGLYLNLWWILCRLPERTMTLNFWRWRVILEPNPDPMSRKRPW